MGNETLLAGLFGQVGGAGLVGRRDLVGGHGVDSLGSDLAVVADGGPVGFDGGDEGVSSAGVVLVGFYGGLLVVVSAGDPPVEGGGGVFFPVGLGRLVATAGPTVRSAAVWPPRAYRVVGPGEPGG